MASAPPVFGTVFDIDTVGALAARIKRDINEPMNPSRVESIYGHIGDALESIWMSALLCSLSKFIKGPVQQVVSQPTTNLVSVPDPTSAPLPTQQAGGTLLLRTLYLSYCLVTDSGSTTRLSPLASLIVSPNFLAVVPAPLNPASSPLPDGVVGWYLFAGFNPDGSDQGQQSIAPMPFNQSWYEPPSGILSAPQSPAPPSDNTTGDNIFAITRIDVQNVDQTWTNWLQSTMGGSWWTEFQHKIATQTTWNPFVYDFIDNRQLEVRPAPAMPMDTTYFYTNKPRRPRFPQSRIPFTSFACQAFLYNYAMSRTLLSIYEFEAGDRWNKYAEEERQRIMLQIGQGNWNTGNTVRPFMR